MGYMIKKLWPILFLQSATPKSEICCEEKRKFAPDTTATGYLSG